MTTSQACASQRIVHVEPLPERKRPLELLIEQAFQAACRSLDRADDIAFVITSQANDSSYPLEPEEVGVLSPRACLKRRLSWSAGRGAAKLALKQSGIRQPVPLLRGSTGEPLWPNDISGSITHCYPWSVAAVAQSQGGVFLGIDLESLDRIQDVSIGTLVCRKSELEWVRAGEDPCERICMIFSAKEALYKSLYPGYRRYIEFQEVELMFSEEQSCFRATITSPENHVQGRVSAIPALRYDNLIFSCSVYETR